jgi:hypothetical protein
MGSVRKVFYFEQKETKGTKKADFKKGFGPGGSSFIYDLLKVIYSGGIN